MLNGLDLFSGIGGLTIALSDWVRPVAYCEIERYASAVLLSRMSEGKLPIAPIWDDVTTLKGNMLPEIDIIYGGFPCQDISVAGNGKGLAGERSGLFFEIMRLVDEIQPKFIFLENVPAITTRGLSQVTAEITKRGYDSRWTTLSAAEIGANHKRERWWLLGYAKHNGSLATEKRGSSQETISNNSQGQNKASEFEGTDTSSMLSKRIVSDSESKRAGQDNRGLWQRACGANRGQATSQEDVADSSSLRPQEQRQSEQSERSAENQTRQTDWANSDSWWSTEPNVGRVVAGIPYRVDRLKGLGNAVVPLQAKTAFKILMGLNFN